MELHPGAVPRNERDGRNSMSGESAHVIPVNVDLSELLDTVPGHSPVIDDRGFTLADVIAQRGVKRARAQQIIVLMIESGKIKHVGYRSRTAGAKVYEIIATMP